MVTKIYVALTDEGVDCWRPIDAERLQENIFRIIGTPPPDEQWQFSCGEVVRCENRRFDGSDALELVAIERMDEPSS